METNQEKKMEPPKYITHTSNELRLNDLEKTVTIEQVEREIEKVADSIELDLLALVDHWTDDSGLHRAPFEAELLDTIKESLKPFLARLAREGGDS